MVDVGGACRWWSVDDVVDAVLREALLCSAISSGRKGNKRRSSSYLWPTMPGDVRMPHVHTARGPCMPKPKGTVASRAREIVVGAHQMAPRAAPGGPSVSSFASPAWWCPRRGASRTTWPPGLDVSRGWSEHSAAHDRGRKKTAYKTPRARPGPAARPEPTRREKPASPPGERETADGARTSRRGDR